MAVELDMAIKAAAAQADQRSNSRVAAGRLRAGATASDTSAKA